jgi:hypothetical protein
MQHSQQWLLAQWLLEQWLLDGIEQAIRGLT